MRWNKNVQSSFKKRSSVVITSLDDLLSSRSHTPERTYTKAVVTASSFPDSRTATTCSQSNDGRLRPVCCEISVGRLEINNDSTTGSNAKLLINFSPMISVFRRSLTFASTFLKLFTEPEMSPASPLNDSTAPQLSRMYCPPLLKSAPLTTENGDDPQGKRGKAHRSWSPVCCIQFEDWYHVWSFSAHPLMALEEHSCFLERSSCVRKRGLHLQQTDESTGAISCENEIVEITTEREW